MFFVNVKMDSNSFSSFLNSEVHCRAERDTEKHSDDWFGDTDSEYEWCENKSLHSSSFSTLTHTGTNEDVNNSGLFEDQAGCSQNKENWKTTDLRYVAIVGENERLKSQLAREKNRSMKYLKKLQFIQDNYEIFNKLKEAYLNMKYNESFNRPLVEIREKSCQTWQGILCKTCIETAEIRRILKLDEQDMILVKREDLNYVRQTFDSLKENLKKNDVNNMLKDQREIEFRKTITKLLEENIALQNSLEQKDSETKNYKQIAEQKKSASKDSSTLRKIIYKLEMKLRKENGSKTSLKEKEKKIVQHIMDKYNRKKFQNTSSSNPSISDKIVTPYMTPRTAYIDDLDGDTISTYRSFEGCDDYQESFEHHDTQSI